MNISPWIEGETSLPPPVVTGRQSWAVGQVGKGKKTVDLRFLLKKSPDTKIRVNQRSWTEPPKKTCKPASVETP